MKRHSPRNSVETGIGFLPEDRKSEGLIQQQPIKNNILQASMKRYFKRGLVDKKAEKELAERYRGELKIATPDVTRRVSALSGGNQQKLSLIHILADKNVGQTEYKCGRFIGTVYSIRQKKVNQKTVRCCKYKKMKKILDNYMHMCYITNSWYTNGIQTEYRNDL